MSGWNFVGDCRCQRGENGVDNRRHDKAPARHGRGVTRHHDISLGDNYIHRAESAFVDRIERRGKRFVGHARSGQGARIDAGFSLG